MTTTDKKTKPEKETTAKDKKEKPKQKAAYNKKKVSAKEVRKILRGQAHIQSSYNNTVICLTDLSGNALAWGSAGRLGFKGAKKATPYAATLVVNNAIERVKKYGLREVDVFLKGIGAGREAAVRALQANGFQVMSIKDVTPIPHNGCRPKKPRRV
ncbi:30S ribosomal protein S11 [Patescibacteria group bacterium]